MSLVSGCVMGLSKCKCWIETPMCVLSQARILGWYPHTRSISFLKSNFLLDIHPKNHLRNVLIDMKLGLIGLFVWYFPVMSSHYTLKDVLLVKTSWTKSKLISSPTQVTLELKHIPCSSATSSNFNLHVPLRHGKLKTEHLTGHILAYSALCPLSVYSVSGE